MLAISAPLPGADRSGGGGVVDGARGRGLPRPAAAALPAARDAERADGAGRRRGGHAAHLRALRGAAAAGSGARFIAGRQAVGGGRARARGACAPGCGCSTRTGCGSGCCSSCRRSCCCSRSPRRATPRSPRPAPGGETPPAVAVALHDELRRNPPDRLSPALLLHGALRAPPAAREARPPPDRRAPARARRRLRLRAPAAARRGRGGRAPAAGAPGARRLPTLRVGASDERTLDFALACVDAVDADLLDATRLH